MRRKGIVIASALTVGCLASCFLAYRYRDRLHELTDNSRWETRLRRNHVYEQQRIVLFGDSEFGYWPMAESFGDLPIINRGVPGDYATDAIDRFDRDVLALSPTTVAILLGTNDLGVGRTPDEVAAIVDRMVAEAQRRMIRVIVCGLLPVSGDYLTSRPLSSVRALNDRLSRIAAKHGVEFVDFFGVLANQNGQFNERLTRDGLHPNNDGYVRMTTRLLPVLLKSFTGS